MELHCACRRKRTAATSSTTDGHLTALTDKSQTAPHGSATCLIVRARFCHERLWDTIWTPFGQLPGAPRTPPGRSSDASRTESWDTFKCFVLNALCSKVKKLIIVLRHGIRPDFLEIHLLYKLTVYRTGVAVLLTMVCPADAA